MANDKTLYIIGGLGLLYFLFSKSATAGPSPYPVGTRPPGGAPAGTRPPGGGSSTGGGGATGGGAGGGGVPGGAGSTSGTPRPATVYTCADGSVVLDASTCITSATPIGGECADGTYVDDYYNQCPENLPSNTDTMDPCDPNSIMYDPSQCGQPSGVVTGLPDSGDPCDPYSVYYDPNACYGSGVDYTCYDTGDICNPDDCNYDPNLCSG